MKQLLETLAFALILIVSIVFEAHSQSTVLIQGSKYYSVQYDTGSAKKFYDSNSSFDIGRRDSSAKTFAPKSRNDVYRCGLEFDLLNSGIARGSTIDSVKLLVTVNGSTYNAKIKSLDSTQQMLTPESLWLGIDQSGTTYFSTIPYGSYLWENSSAGLKQAVQGHVYRGIFKAGIMSMSEGTDFTNTTVEVYLRVYYTLPPAQISIANSFGGGVVTIDGDERVSGWTQTWSAGSGHELEAIDQEWPASSMKQRTFDELWNKKTGLQTTQAGTSRSLPITVSPNEVATYIAMFRTTVNVSGTLTIQSSYSLDPGTNVICQSGSQIRVLSSLSAIGNADSVITFTTPGGVSWQGLQFEGSASSVLTYCRISHATAPVKAIDATNVSLSHVTIDSSNFINYEDDAALSFYSSTPLLDNIVVNGGPSSVNGVRFAEGSAGTLQNSTIHNCGAGNGIVIQGGSTPTITGNTISGNYYYGIVFPTNGYPYAKIMNNTISSNNGGGVVLNGSNSVVKNNLITGSNVGIYLENSSYLTSVDNSESWLARKKGGNLVYANNYGLIGYSSAYYYFGDIVYEPAIDDNRWDGACNDIYGNSSWNIYTSWTQFKAKGNYWATGTPSMTFVVGDGATVQYEPFNEFSGQSCSELESRVLADGPTKSPTETATLDQLTKARIAENFPEGLSLCREILSSNAPISVKHLALVELAAIIRDTRDESLIEELEGNRFGDAALREQAELMRALAFLGFDKYDEALEVYDGIIAASPGTPTAKMALMSLASLSAFDRKYEPKSHEALNTLASEFGEELDEGWLVALGRRKADLEKPAAATEATDESTELEMYPNPFNPSTEIRFKVATPGEVRLEIFDLLGRSVDILANSMMAAGTHQVTWNGDRNPSGVYLLRLTSGNVSITRKLLLAK